MGRLIKKMLSLGFASLGAIALSAAISSPAHAAFDPGHIIDNAIFTNSNAMSPQDIQSFLTSKVPVCDTGHAPDPNWSQGSQPPWTCLKDYYENPSTLENNLEHRAIPAGGISAAQIIWNASQTYSINPQVILVTIQKESASPGLENDTWPYPWQFKTPLGMGCPDGAPCDSQYFGFYNQVSQAARHMHCYYLASEGTPCPGFFTPYVKGVRTIAFHPNSSCGSSSVNIINGATAALYNYTPYQPNAASLAAGFGTGDGCSSYGNRNFYNYFTAWFGSTYTDHYSFVSAVNPPRTMAYSDVATAEVKLANNSNETWYSDTSLPSGTHPHRLMMVGYANTSFADDTDPAWLGTHNQVQMLEPSVAPGATATFRFRVKAPAAPIDSEQLNMTLVKDGVQVYKSLGLQFLISTAPDYTFSIQSIDTPVGILPGDMYRIKINLLNTGVRTWYSDDNVSAQNPHPIRLATPYYQDSPYAFPRVDSNWLGTKNQIKLTNSSVAPGQVGVFQVIFTGPYKSIPLYEHNFQMVLDGIRFIAGPRIPIGLSTPPPTPDYAFVSATNPPSVMTYGSKSTPYIKIRNTGNVIWRNFDNKILSNDGTRVDFGDMRLITNVPVYRNSAFADTSAPEWLGTRNQSRMLEPIVGPGQIGTFNLPLAAPSVQGHYTEYFIFGIDGLAILKDLGLAYPITVQP